MGIYEEIVQELEKLVIPEMPLIDIAETIEAHIRQAGYLPAFPVNISINEVAAHYTPGPNDQAVIGEEDLVKIDFGYHNGDGLTIDNAVTIDLSGTHTTLVKAAEQAVMEAIKVMKPGVPISEISRVIYETTKKYNVKPIENLTGHSIERWLIHGGVPLPSVPNNIDYRLRVGDRIAVEVFTTTPEGAGRVIDGGEPHIFSLVSLSRGVRTQASRKLLHHIVREYKTLPFSDRWLAKVMGSRFMAKSGLTELIKNHLVEGYPPLKEEKRQPVAQYENTVVITEQGAVILTD